MKILFFRKLIGTNDTCPRNIIVNTSDLKCCSIDDPVKMTTETGFMFKKQLNHNLKLQFNASLKSVWNQLYEFICQCSDIILSNQKKINNNELVDFMLNVCDEYSDIDNWNF